MENSRTMRRVTAKIIPNFTVMVIAHILMFKNDNQNGVLLSAINDHGKILTVNLKKS